MQKNSKKKPAISIVIPVYNAEKYVRRCLDSVLEQTFENFEVVIVDDGSIDDTRGIVDDICKKDKRVRAYHLVNRGVSGARNFGIEKACGDYIMFADSDDILDRDFLGIMIDAVEKNNLDVVMCRYYRCREHGHCSDGNEDGGNLEIFTDMNMCLKAMSGREEEFINPPWNKIYRRSIIGKIRFDEDIKIAEDVLFNVKVLDKASRIGMLSRRLYYYMVHDDSAIHSASLESALSAREAFRRIADFLNGKAPDLLVNRYILKQYEWNNKILRKCKVDAPREQELYKTEMALFNTLKSKTGLTGVERFKNLIKHFIVVVKVNVL